MLELDSLLEHREKKALKDMFEEVEEATQGVCNLTEF